MTRRSRTASVLIAAAVFFTAATFQAVAGGTRESSRKAAERFGRLPSRWNQPVDAEQLAGEVRAQFLLAWDAYKKYAWGYDELRPLSKSGYNWYGTSFLMTPVDALDTMILMGLKTEADTTRRYIDTHLSFDRDVFVSTFEFTIRFVGGLESAYQLTGDERLLALARDLADRELPAFDSPTGMPYGEVNLKTGAVRRPVTNPAEVGTSIVELGTLSKLTGDPKYYNASMKALEALYHRRSAIGLVGQGIDVRSGDWTSRESHISGGIDSYYEYLVKCARLFGDSRCESMAKQSLEAVNTYLADQRPTGLWYGHADMVSGRRTRTVFGSLDAYFPAVLVLAGEVDRARKLEQSAFAMWNLYGIEPELFDYVTKSPVDPHYYLRPEIMESAYYLFTVTGDVTYQRMARTFLRDLERYCRTDAGYAELSSVVSKRKMDVMPSYFLAETLKYLYLTFAKPSPIDFNAVTFNTEAHPIRRTW